MIDESTAQYRLSVLQEQIENQKSDEYDLARVGGSKVHPINIGIPELTLLCHYYEGLITDDQIQAKKYC